MSQGEIALVPIRDDAEPDYHAVFKRIADRLREHLTPIVREQSQKRLDEARHRAEEAVRLVLACMSSSAISGVRHVALADGTLDDGGELRFDLSQRSFIDHEILPLRDEILPQLKLPDMTGRRFRAGVFSAGEP